MGDTPALQAIQSSSEPIKDDDTAPIKPTDIITVVSHTGEEIKATAGALSHSRLFDRLLFTRTKDGKCWKEARLRRIECKYIETHLLRYRIDVFTLGMP